MKRFKLIVGILGLIWMLSFSYGAELRITPGVLSFGKNCVQGFNIYVDMTDGEEAMALDLVIDSNMEFVNFENAGLFTTYIPPYKVGKINHLILFNENGENSKGGLVGKIYYKSILDENPYINLIFNGEGEGGDCNVSVDGNDLLKKVHNGFYTLDSLFICESYTGDYYDESDYQKALNEVEFTLGIKSDKNNIFNIKLLGISLGILIIFVLLFVFVRKGKK